MDRSTNRSVALADLQGRPLKIVPEALTRSHLEALAKPPLFERVYTPADCAPDEAVTPPPVELEGVLERSNLNNGQSRVRVEIYTAPDEAGLVDYFVGADPEPLVWCTVFSVTVGEVTQVFPTPASTHRLLPRIFTWSSTASRRTALSPTIRG